MVLISPGSSLGAAFVIDEEVSQGVDWVVIDAVF